MSRLPFWQRLGLAYRALKEGSWSVSSDGVTVAFGVQDSASGVVVTEGTSMQSTAVYACVRILSETVASCPLYLYERESDGGRKRAEAHPVFELMASRPNRFMGPMTWEQVCMQHVTTWGNHYSYIVRDGSNRPAELLPLAPNRVTPDYADEAGSEIVYRYQPMRGERVPVVVAQDDMFHVSGLSSNGLVGLSVIEQNRDTVGLDLAQRKFGAAFFGSSSRPGGTLETKDGVTLSKEAKKRIKEDWEAGHQGPQGWHRVAVLDGGLEFKELGIKPGDAQYVQQMQFSLEQIARIFGVPLTLLQSPEKGANYGGGIEQLTIQFNTYTLRPYMVRIEQEAKRKLLSEGEQGTHFFEHLQDALLRGDIKTRYESHKEARNWGWASTNDIRRMENLKPIDEPWADKYMVPGNMVEAQNLELIGVTTPPAAPATKGSNGHDLLRPVLLRDLRVLFNRECKALRTALDSRSAAEFVEWLPGYYRSFESFATDHCRDTIEAVGKASRNGEAGSWADSWCSRIGVESQQHLETVLRESVDRALDSKSALVLALDAWEKDKAESVCAAILGEWSET